MGTGKCPTPMGQVGATEPAQAMGATALRPCPPRLGLPLPPALRPSSSPPAGMWGQCPLSQSRARAPPNSTAVAPAGGPSAPVPTETGMSRYGPAVAGWEGGGKAVVGRWWGNRGGLKSGA